MNSTPGYPVIEYFETIYKLSDDVWGSSASDLAKEAAAIVKIYFKNQNELHILDLGCGDGRDSLFFAQQGWNVTSVDISQNAIDNLTRHTKQSNLENIKTICCAVEDFLPDKNYHLIFSNYSIHFLDIESRHRLYSTIRKHTVDGGINALLAIKDLNDNYVGPLNEYKYLNSNELSEVYQDWHLLDDYEGDIIDQHPGTDEHKHSICYIIARNKVRETVYPKHNVRNSILGIIIFMMTLCVLLCTLGYHSLNMKGIADIWPGAIFQALFGSLFGGWGVLATLCASTITNAINVKTIYSVLGFIPANFIQSFIPAYYYRKLLKNGGWKKSDLKFTHFALFAVIIPNLIGGILGSIAISHSTNLSLSSTYIKWITANIPISILLGWPLFRMLTPQLIEEGWIIKGWWK